MWGVVSAGMLCGALVFRDLLSAPSADAPPTRFTAWQRAGFKLGGFGVVPATRELVSGANTASRGDALMTYVGALATTVLVLIVVAGGFTALLAFRRRRRALPERLADSTHRTEAGFDSMVESVAFAWNAARVGATPVRELLNREFPDNITKQRDDSIELLAEMCTLVGAVSVNPEMDARRLQAIIQIALDGFLKRFFESSQTLRRFRGSIYVKDDAVGNLEFFTGASAQDAPHTRKPHSLGAGSLAEHALEHPGRVHIHEIAAPGGTPFCHRSVSGSYKVVLACAITPFARTPGRDGVEAVLCVDCADDAKDLNAFYVHKMMVVFAQCLNDVITASRITGSMALRSIIPPPLDSVVGETRSLPPPEEGESSAVFKHVSPRSDRTVLDMPSTNPIESGTRDREPPAYRVPPAHADRKRG